jgi:uncharacterized protein (DUF58 family)
MSNGTMLELDALIRLRSSARGLELGSRRRSLSAQAGGYLSAYRGRGMEFDEVRVYQPSDDARAIDWRVTARRGRPHTKLFREERERPVFIFVDLHPGMYFGSRVQYKSVLAGQIGALLGWAAVRAGDCVGGIISAAEGHQEIHPAARAHGLLALLHGMVRLQPKRPGSLRHGYMDLSLARAVRLVRPGSLVVIISDFREMGEEGDKHLGVLARHNDVVASFLFDPLEAMPPRAGRYQLGDRRQRLRLDTGSLSVAEQWTAQFQMHRDKVRGHCQRHGIHYMEAATSDKVLRALQIGLIKHRSVN